MRTDRRRAGLAWVVWATTFVALLSSGFCAWMAKHQMVAVYRLSEGQCGIELEQWPALGVAHEGAAAALLAWRQRAEHVGEVAGFVAAFTVVWWWQEWTRHRQRRLARASGVQ